jgi:hypothetical protein
MYFRLHVNNLHAVSNTRLLFLRDTNTLITTQTTNTLITNTNTLITNTNTLITKTKRNPTRTKRHQRRTRRILTFHSFQILHQIVKICLLKSSPLLWYSAATEFKRTLRNFRKRTLVHLQPLILSKKFILLPPGESPIAVVVITIIIIIIII